MEQKITRNHSLDPEVELLNTENFIHDVNGGPNEGLKNAPIFTEDAFRIASDLFPQRALTPKLYMNANAPFSGIICGVQGSGKSHSTSVLLESCLIRDERLGTLPEPLSGLMFHYESAGPGGHMRPCEAAYLASLDETQASSTKGTAKPPKVTVLVMPNTLLKMKKAYASIPEVTVEPLYFAPEDINAERLLAMMKVDQGQHVPLYMECVMNQLRSVDEFDYPQFRGQILEQEFSKIQKDMLTLRLKLLDSCLEGGNSNNRVSNYFQKGHLIIIDLTSPFMDPSSASGLFDIILGLFIEARNDGTGKIVVLDEAHKYLASNGSSSRLTDSLLFVIRQQRHLGTRVLISTQEPTVIPSQIFDLCSFVIAHRFQSPKWLDYLKQHIAVGDIQSFSMIYTLQPGEAMIFSPAGVGRIKAYREDIGPFGPGYLLVRSRGRITRDGGRSLFAAEPSNRRTNTEVGNGAFTAPTRTNYALERAPENYSTESSAFGPHNLSRDRLTNHHPAPPGVGPQQRAEPRSVAPASEPRFELLKTILASEGRMSWSDLETKLRNRSPIPQYQGHLRDYLHQAKTAELVELGHSAGKPWVQLVHKNVNYAPLVDTLKILLQEGDRQPRVSVVAEKLIQRCPNAYVRGKFRRYREGAEAAGVIICDTKKDRMSLRG